MKVAVYMRVSSDEQKEKGTIKNQEEFALKYCDLHELEIFKMYKDDGISGTIPLEERPTGKELLEDAKEKKFDTLLIYKLDRLGRTPRITLNSIYELESQGIQISSMTEPFDTSNPTGRFMITILAGVAGLERENILERMWIGTNRAARNGKWLGGIVPYGYYVDDDGYIQVNENTVPGTDLKEADIIRLIFDLIANKKYSTIKVADYLNALEIPPLYTKMGRKITKGKRQEATAGIWRPGAIRRIIKNKTYMGIHEYGKNSKKKDREIIVREVPSIVDEDIWNKAQAVLTENQIESFKNSTRDYLLRGLIKCGNCGLTYIGINYKNTNINKKAYYVCVGKQAYKGPKQGKCTSKNVPADYLEELVWNDIVNFVDAPGEALKTLQENLDIKKSNKNEITQEKKILEKSILDKENEKQSILDLFRKKIIDLVDVEKQISKIAQEMNNIKERILELENELENEDSIDSRFNSAEELLYDLKDKVHNNPDFKARREIVKILVNKVTVNTVIKENGRASAGIQIEYNFSKVFSTRSRISRNYSHKIARISYCTINSRNFYNSIL